jgi:hypothetical protein
MRIKWSLALAASVSMIGIATNATDLELTQGRVLGFHSEPSGGCPGLDWHLVAC